MGFGKTLKFIIGKKTFILRQKICMVEPYVESLSKSIFTPWCSCDVTAMIYPSQSYFASAVIPSVVDDEHNISETISV